jgi:DNA-binding Lrp family transcriptional regulator
LKFDSVDIEIVKLLQKNARKKIAEIARNLGIAHNAALHRYKKIKDSGIIKTTYCPVFLPQYTNRKKFTYKMQILIRSDLNEIYNLVSFVKKIDLSRCQIECFETYGHYNIFVWVISEEVIDVQIIKGRIQNQKGVQEIKVNILREMEDLYTEINLDHLKGMNIYGSD